MSGNDRGTQTAAEQTKIQAKQEQNADADSEKTFVGSIAITVIMAVITAFVILMYGFKDSDCITTSVTTICISVAVCGFKWILDIKNLIRRKKREARKGTEGIGRDDL